MPPTAAPLEPAQRLLAELACPHCWHRFSPDEVRFVATHPELLGDERLGDDEYRRFLPTRFTPAGDALDARGQPCHELACPRCHLVLPRPLLQTPPWFLSIIGAPAAGKSCLLAAMLWQARQRLGRFALSFADADPAANRRVQADEQRLFLAGDPNHPVAVRKTETAGPELYREVRIDGQTLTFPTPFAFNVAPHDHHPSAFRDFPHRVVILYDNAGESFLPGSDVPAAPVTRHLAESEALLFVFDPVQDPRLRQHCQGADPQLQHGPRPGATWGSQTRQEVVLLEAATRVRRYRGLAAGRRHDKPLLVVLAKADLWAEYAGVDLNREPILPPTKAGGVERLDLERVGSVSDACRAMLREVCPELINAAEGFCDRVLYVPVSALGGSPELVQAPGGESFYGVRPARVRPQWALVPLLAAMRIRLPKLFGS